MAPRRLGSASSASDSQSPPSDAPSPHFSPLSNGSPSLHHPSDDGDSPGPRSVRNTPSRTHTDLSRSYSAGKGGCWTCRLRRKKCDEQRVADSCKTCIRLNIECLGWGAKRPDWMRDKQQVQSYRNKITDKLRRENRIRGQPRSTYAQQPQLLSSTPSAPAAVTNGRGRPRPRPYGSTPALSSPDWQTSEPTGRNSQQAFLSSQRIPTPVSAGSSPHIPGIVTLGNYPDTLNALDLSTSLPFPLISSNSHSPISLPLDSLPNIPYNLYPIDFDLHQPTASALQLQTSPPPLQLSQQLSSQQAEFSLRQSQQVSNQTSELVLYFFEHVKSLQFKLFGGTNDVTNVIYSIIVQEPRGPVASAVCAVASLHFTRMRQAAGYEASDSSLEHSSSKRFYDNALLELLNSKHHHGSYSESDAIAALTLTSFALSSGGCVDWPVTLQIAQDWLAESGILRDENPRVFIANMGSGGNFAMKTTIWLDIFVSITSRQQPRFMDLYHRLFANDTGFSVPLRMEQVTGFSDDVLYAIAQISTLASWKSRESLNGCLSVRELIRRGNMIEQRLRQGEREDARANGIELDIGFTGETLPSLSQDSAAFASAGPHASDDIRRIVRSLFRETAILYLDTILSDPNPSVREITAGVDSVFQLLQQLPPSDLDQALVFPICLAGCMTDNQGQRQHIISRIQRATNIGNLLQGRSSMEFVWQKRDMYRQTGAHSWEVADWRESLGGQGSNLLLV